MSCSFLKEGLERLFRASELLESVGPDVSLAICFISNSWAGLNLNVNLNIPILLDIVGEAWDVETKQSDPQCIVHRVSWMFCLSSKKFLGTYVCLEALSENKNAMAPSSPYTHARTHAPCCHPNTKMAPEQVQIS